MNKKGPLNTNKKQIIKGKTVKREFLQQLKDEIETEIYYHLIRLEKRIIKKKDILNSLMTRIDYFLYLINDKIDRSTDLHAKKGLHDVRYRYTLLVDAIVRKSFQNMALNLFSLERKKLTKTENRRIIQKIEELTAFYSSLLDGEVFIDNVEIFYNENQINITFFLERYNLLGFQQDNPFYEFNPADRQQIPIPSLYKDLLEKAVKSNKWSSAIRTMKKDNFLKIFYKNSPKFEHYNPGLLTEEGFLVTYDFLTLFYYFASVTRLIINEMNKRLGALKYNKIFSCSDTEMIKYLTEFSSQTISEKSLEALISFERKIRENSLMNFSPFFRITKRGGSGRWFIIPNYFLAYYRKLWGSFNELMLMKKRVKGDYFEEEIRSLFRKYGFQVWGRKKLSSFNILLHDLGGGDVDIVIHDIHTTLWIQAKSTTNNLKSYRNLIRKGRIQLLSAITTYNNEFEAFSKEFHCLEIKNYVVTPSALPYKFTSDSKIEVISLDIIERGLKDIYGDISNFINNVNIYVEKRKKEYQNKPKTQTARSKNKVITIGFQ